MKRMLMTITACCLLSGGIFFAQPSGTGQTGNAVDSSSHTVKFVTVEKDVKLEVFDWGGAGRPLVLLAGLMFDAHVYDLFAPKLVKNFHVCGITRRGFGASSAPKPDCGNYSADRLGDDVLAVMNNLKIDRPVLVGHSLAGEELSSIGSRFPERVAGLIYLDAANSYAFYNDSATQGDPIVDSADLRMELEQLIAPLPRKEMKARVTHVLEVSIPRMERDLRETLKNIESAPDSPPPLPDNPMFRAMAAVMREVQTFSSVNSPILAIYAAPHDMHQVSGGDTAKQATLEASDLAQVKEQVKAVQAANPSAHVVLLPHADHFVFRSNEADLLREMNAFIGTLQ
jgi:pimeloyl-ACP methyl ester carboxylesterase